MTADTVVLGGRTLREVVALMDRFTGIREIVDIPPVNEHRRSVYTNRTHFWVRTTEDEQWTMQHLACNDHLSYRPGQDPQGGWTIWEMYIAYNFRPRGDRRVWGPRITAANFDRLFPRIRYVIAPERDVTADLDHVERVLSSIDHRLASIGGWVDMDLQMLLECACGHTASIRARETFAGFPADRKTSDVVGRLRCIKCDEINVADVVALYADGNSASVLYNREGRNRSGRSKLSRVDELYGNLGGDGEEPVYAGDGIYVRPDGRLEE